MLPELSTLEGYFTSYSTCRTPKLLNATSSTQFCPADSLITPKACGWLDYLSGRRNRQGSDIQRWYISSLGIYLVITLLLRKPLNSNIVASSFLWDCTQFLFFFYNTFVLHVLAWKSPSLIVLVHRRSLTDPPTTFAFVSDDKYNW